MAAIKSKNTKPELWLRKRLHALGFRYRLNVKDLPGKPDVVLPKYRTAIFVNGCFWHMHDCEVFRLPSTRTKWWYEKLSKNQQRDIKNQELLLHDGWRVLVVWECAIKGRLRQPEEVLISDIQEWLLYGSVFTQYMHQNFPTLPEISIDQQLE